MKVNPYNVEMTLGWSLLKVMKMKQMTKINGLASIAIRSVRSALCWQRRVCNTQVQGETTGHLPVVVEVTCVHRHEKRAELNPVVKELVLQLPGQGNA